MNLKYLRKSYSSDSYTATDPLFTENGRSSSSLGIDLGCFYKIAPKYTAGLMLRNLNQPDMGIKDKDSLPIEYKAGVSYWMRNGVVDLDFGLSEGNFYSSVGSEYWLHKKFAGRLGFLIGNNDRRNFNIGFGSKFSMFYMDYAFSLPIGGISGTSGSHNISFSIKFGKPEEEIPEEQIQNLQKQLSLSIKQMKKSQENAILQEKRIKELEEKLKQQREIIQSFATGEQPVQIIMPEVPTDTKVLESQIEKLKEELIKSRREVEQFKAKR